MNGQSTNPPQASTQSDVAFTDRLGPSPSSQLLRTYADPPPNMGRTWVTGGSRYEPTFGLQE